MPGEGTMRGENFWMTTIRRAGGSSGGKPRQLLEESPDKEGRSTEAAARSRLALGFRLWQRCHLLTLTTKCAEKIAFRDINCPSFAFIVHARYAIL